MRDRNRAPCENALGKNPKLKNAHFSTCTRPSPSFKLVAWLPRLCRAPSQLARRDGWNVMAPPLRLSGGTPDGRSGDADQAEVGNEAALAALLSSERKH